MLAVKDDSCQQLELPLFPDLSFEEIIGSEGISGFSVRFSSRLKRSWHLKTDRRSGTRILTIPLYLQTAPLAVKKSLIEWSHLPDHSGKANTAVKKRKTFLEKQIQSHIGNLAPSLYSSALDTTTLEQQTKGSRYDLREVFSSINETYFQSSVAASVRWGSYGSLTSYQMTRVAKNGKPVNLITIAGVYNHPDVPGFALEAVMYHEMLHIVVPPYNKGGSRIIHGPEFKQKERQYAFYKQWCEWEKKNLRNLVGSLRKKQRRERL